MFEGVVFFAIEFEVDAGHEVGSFSDEVFDGFGFEFDCGKDGFVGGKIG